MAMRRCVSLIVALGLLLVGLLSSAVASAAQPKGAKPAAEAKKDKDKPKAKPKVAGDEGAEGEEGAEEGEQEEEEDEKPGEKPDEGAPSSLDELCKISPDECPDINMDELAARELRPDMYAVQQIWAFRKYRFELNGYLGLTMNDQFVSHPGPGLAVNFYILNWLAAGINGNLYAGLNTVSDFNFETSRAARVGLPLTEYQFNANLNATFVPVYGKFAAFQDFIFHYDFYVPVGGGIINTRPIAVVDPDNRNFDFTLKPVINFGIGARIFFTRYLAATLEVRDYIILGEEIENPAVATGTDPATGRPRAQLESTWTGDGPALTNNVQGQIGVSLFLPLTWTYQEPK
jgi:outer membrane beta-barrel protein